MNIPLTNASRADARPAVLAGARAAAQTRAAGVLNGAIFCALLTLVALVAIPYGTVEPWWEAAFECAAFALAALSITEGLLRGSWRVRELRLLAPLLALAAFALIQTLPLWGAGTAGVETAGVETGLLAAVSADPFETRRFALKFLSLVICGELLLCYTARGRRRRALVWIIIGVGVGSAFFGIVRQTAQHTTGFVLPYLEPGVGYGQLINRNHFALLMELTLGLVLGLCVGGGVDRRRWPVYAAAALPIWTALVLTTSRGGILSMLCQLLFLALMFSRARRPADEASCQPPDYGPFGRRRAGGSVVVRAALVGCLMAAVAASVVWVGGDQLSNRMENLPREMNVESTSQVRRGGAQRVEVWRATWEMIKASPTAGVGFGAYGVAITRYHNASGQLTPEAAHNDYLELIASGGLIGIACAVWFVLLWLRRARGTLRAADPFRRAASLGALTGLAGVAVHSLVDFGLHITANALVSVALIAITVAADGADGEIACEPKN